MGYPVFYSDLVAKELIVNNFEVKQKIIKAFSMEAYLTSGELNKTFISKLIFSDKNKLEQINQIVHPAVKIAFNNWVEQQDNHIVFYESAILFETDSYKEFDKVILVTASKDTKISRIIKRDNIQKEDIEKRMNNQWKDEQKIPLADYIIINNNNSMLVEQINDIVSDIRKK